MEEFLKNLIAALPIALVAIPAGWLGSLINSYFNEKGKNVATKEDIEEITEKIEFVKNRFEKISRKSDAFIERQLIAFDTITQLINKIILYLLQQSDENDYAVNFDEYNTSKSEELGIQLREKVLENQIFINDKNVELLFECSHKIFEISEIEKVRKPSGPEYDSAHRILVEATKALKEELFSNV
jgi:hypothetical protein